MTRKSMLNVWSMVLAVAPVLFATAAANAANGTYVGSPTLGVANKWASGDTAATFASGKYLDVSTSSANFQDFSGGMTIEFWTNHTPVGGEVFVSLCNASGSSTDSIAVIANAGTPSVLMISWWNGTSGTAQRLVYSQSGVLATGWHLYDIVMATDGTISMYKDGAVLTGLTASGSGIPRTTVTRTYDAIGKGFGGTSYNLYLAGTMDEVAIYKSALTSTRISAHYAAASAAAYNTAVLADTPVDYWRLGEASGTNAADSAVSVPNAPTVPLSYPASATGITWSWLDNSTNETGFKVYADPGTTPTTLRTTTAASVTSWNGYTGLSANTQHAFTVKATNANGDSTAPTAITEYTLNATPTAPTFGTYLTDGTGYTVTTSGPANLTGSAKVTFNRDGTDRTAVAALYEAITGLTANTSYAWKANATNADGTLSLGANGPYPGTKVGTVSYQQTSKWGSADAMSAAAAAGNYVNISGGGYTFGSNACTFECWYYGPTTNTCFLSLNTSNAGGADNNNRIDLRTSTGSAYVAMNWRDNSTSPGLQKYAQTSATGFTANTWTHIVGTITSANPAVTTIYINGVDATSTRDSNGSTTFTGSVNRTYGAIGHCWSNAAYLLGGTIDEVAIYDKALSAAQIAAHASARVPGSAEYAAMVMADGPKSYYRLNEASPAATFYDSAGGYGPSASEVTWAKNPTYDDTNPYDNVSVRCDAGQTKADCTAGQTITFTYNNTTFGSGAAYVGKFDYSWDQSATWNGTSPAPTDWASGATLAKTAGTAGQSYYLHLRSYNNDSPMAANTSILNLGPYTVGACTTPNAPTAGTATPNSTTQITWGWTRASGATGEVYRAYDAQGTPVLKWTSASQGTSYAEGSLSANTLYGTGAATTNQRNLKTYTCAESSALALPAKYTLQVLPTVATFSSVGTSGLTVATTGPVNYSTGSSGVVFCNNGTDRSAVTALSETIASGLTANTQYVMKAKAKNGDGTFTASQNSGTYVAAPGLITDKWSNAQRAMSFDGSTQYVTLPTLGTTTDFSTGFTIECWANPTDLTTDFAGILDLRTTGADNFVNKICMDMRATTGKLRIESYTTGASVGNYYESSSTAFTAGAWNHYAIVVAGNGAITFYKNGTGESLGTVSPMPTAAVARDVNYIARRQGTASLAYWKGGLDEVAVYSYPLTPAQIAGHYAQATKAAYQTDVIADGPVGYWCMEDLSGTVATDSTNGYGPGSYDYTLPAAVTYDGVPTPYDNASIRSDAGSTKTDCTPSLAITFTANNGFGDGAAMVGKYEYVWNTSATALGTGTWSGSSYWTTSTLGVTAGAAGSSSYLHIRSYNNDPYTPSANTTELVVGPYSVPSCTLNTPTAAASSNVATDSIQWNWGIAGNTCADSYKIYDAATSGNLKGTASGNATTSYTETGLDPNTSYSRWVSAYSATAGESARCALTATSTLARTCPENGDFETWTVTTIADHWTQASAGDGTATYGRSSVHRDGTYSQAITDPISGEGFTPPLYQKLNVLASQNYTLRVYNMRSTGATAGCVAHIGVDVNGGTTETAGGDSSGSIGSWITKDVNFTSSTGGVVTVMIKAGYNDSSGTAYFDGVYLMPQKPSSTGADSTTLCSGQSTNLTASGGWSGTNGELHWYTGSGGTGTAVGTGSPLSVSPTTTTTYYARWEPSGWTGTCLPSLDGSPVAITVNALPSVPTSASASTNPICNGGSTTLSATAGSGGDQVWWFTGSCGGTQVGTGAGNKTVSPTTTTTYYAQTTNSTTGCDSSTCAQVTVTVNNSPSAGLTVGALANTVCPNGSTSVTVASSETGVSYQLRNGTTAVGTAVNGTGGTINLPTGNLSSNTTFNVLATRSPCTGVQLTQTKTISVDNVAPAVQTVSPDRNAVITGGLTSVQVTFSESVDSTVAAGNLTVNGSAATSVSANGNTFTFSGYAAPADGDVAIVLSAGSIADGCSNPFTGDSWTIYKDTDLAGPTIASRNPVESTCVPSLTQVVVNFSEYVNGVDAVDLTVGSSAATGLAVSNHHKTYTFTGFTAPGDGPVNVALAADAITDLNGTSFAGSNWTYTVDSQHPSVSSITRGGAAALTKASSVSFTVTFSESVNNVSASDFSLTTSGVSGASIGTPTGSGTTWTVAVNTGTGDGTIRLNAVASGGTAVDCAGNHVTAGYSSGEVYTIDKTQPTLTSIVRAGDTPTNAASVDFTVTFSEAMTGVATSNFSLTATGVSSPSITGIAGSGDTYTVSVNTGTGDGTIRLNMANSTGATDLATNALSTSLPYTGGETYTIDKTAPTIQIGTPSASSACTADSVDYTVTYGGADSITLVSGNVTLNKGSTADGQVSVAPVGNGSTQWTVTVHDITGSGTLGISIASGTASDLATNPAPAAGPSTTFTVVAVSGVPTDGTPTADATDKITWKWSNVSGETGYRVKDTSGAQIGSDLAANTTQWQETGLTANTEYTRRISSFNSCGASDGSTGQSRWTLSVAPGSGSVTPDNASACVGVDVTWTAADGFGAGGVAKYAYAWDQTSGHTWTGSEAEWSGSTLPLAPTAAGTWYLHVKGFNGADVANGTHDYSVTAAVGASITSDPSDQNVLSSATATFTVAASGSGLTYQWQKNEANITNGAGHISGATGTTLTVTGATDADQGSYRCVVSSSSGCGSAQPSVARDLTIAPKADTWYSVKFHGTTLTEYAYPLPATGNPIEPRWGDLLVRVEFDKPVVAVNGSITTSDVTVKDSTGATLTPTSVALVGPTGGGYAKLEIKLAEAQVDKKKWTVKLVHTEGATETATLRRPTSAKALLAGTLDRQVWCLVGDVNRGGFVSMNDIDAVRNAMKPPSNGVVSNSNFLFDVNTSAQINVVDMALIRNKAATNNCLPGMCLP